eukprot:gnl/Trimastix_PCT/1091.p1 GENE.gnl/Trimastix_PCT/1091~~gnl/Trimastix_PCT/1091.p1  ORF type:complete len:579 (-),score=158.22 gnl/Trimastix_PCT/1091:77-1813(-)
MMMRRSAALFLLLLVCVVPACWAASKTSATCVYNKATGKCKLEMNPTTTRGNPSYADFEDSMHELGWGKLRVFTQKDFDDDVQMYSAGFVEGALTHHRIWNQRVNAYNLLGFLPEVIREHMASQRQWIETQIKNNPSDPFWIQQSRTLKQVDGLHDGFMSRAPQEHHLTKKEWWELMNFAQMSELKAKYHDAVSGASTWSPSSTPEDAAYYDAKIGDGACTSLVKLTDDKQDMLFGHCLWFRLEVIAGCLKSYHFHLHDTHVATQKVVFSGFYGFPFSGQHFYVLDSHIGVTETSLSNFRPESREAVGPQSLPHWMRHLAANRLAHSGQEWVSHFTRHIDGLFNSQWNIIDFTRWTKGSNPRPGFLTICETMTIGSEWADKTNEFIARGNMWPSYNVPYFPKIYNGLGYCKALNATGSEFWWGYENHVRARISRRDHVKVQSIHGIRDFLLSNDYRNDPLSVDPKDGLPNPVAAIASRKDLLSPDGVGTRKGSGAFQTDAKWFSASQFDPLRMHAIAGPTHVHQPIFKFSTCPHPASHVGVPDAWDFPETDHVPLSLGEIPGYSAAASRPVPKLFWLM